MNKASCHYILRNFTKDSQLDLLMYLAEMFDCRVLKGGDDITYFIPTGDAPCGNTTSTIRSTPAQPSEPAVSPTPSDSKKD